MRQWIPELRRLPLEFLHAPAEATTDVLTRSGVELGRTYPRPMVDHAQMRQEALAAFQSLKAARAQSA